MRDLNKLKSKLEIIMENRECFILVNISNMFCIHCKNLLHEKYLQTYCLAQGAFNYILDLDDCFVVPFLYV